MSIKEISELLMNATEPEDVFVGSSYDEIKREYRNMAKVCHPDLVSDEYKDLACKTTSLLNKFYDLANKKIRTGIYGVKDKKEIYKLSDVLFSFEHRSKKYDIYSLYCEEDISIIYEGLCDGELIKLKIVNDFCDNDLLEEEYKILKEFDHLGIPKVVSKLKINGRVALIFKDDFGLSIDEVYREYGFINEEHVAWILERLLSLVGFLHSNKIVHGNIKSDNVFIDVENHNVKIIDYSFCIRDANKDNSKYKIINESYSPSYVDKSSKVNTNVDIYAIGKVAILLLGGDINRNAMPLRVSIEMRNFIRKLLDKSSCDAWELWSELINLRNKLYGKNRFKKLERKVR